MNAKQALMWIVLTVLPGAAMADTALDQLKLTAAAEELPAVAAPAAKRADAGGAMDRPASTTLEGILGELVETAALARAIESSASRELTRRPDSQMAKEWSTTAANIAGDLEAERTKLLEAARLSDAARRRETEIAKSLLAPAKRYLARAKRYLDLLESVREQPIPRDVQEDIDRFIDELRSRQRRISRY